MHGLMASVLVALLACIVALGVLQGAALARALRHWRFAARDPQPAAEFSDDALPTVTIQLPIRNEGALAADILRQAAAVDYPHDRLEIQVLDDSDDDETSQLVAAAAATLEAARPSLCITHLHRATRAGFKWGALRGGAVSARGEFLAVFDADMRIPRDFLRRTIHHFTDPAVGFVQTGWDFFNREERLFTRLQAASLEERQQIDDVSSACSGAPAIFRGGAGIWRADALAAAGGWTGANGLAEVAVSVRAALAGWRSVDLIRTRTSRELPETVLAYVNQQMRHTRSEVGLASWAPSLILRAPISSRTRLHLLGVALRGWTPLLGLAATLGALPGFLLGERLDALPAVAAAYVALAAMALAANGARRRAVAISPNRKGKGRQLGLLADLPIGELILGPGMLWPRTQALLEGLAGRRIWVVTPKTGSPLGPCGWPEVPGPFPPLYITGTLALATAGLVLAMASLWLGYPIPAVVHLVAGLASGWVGAELARDLYLRAASARPAPRGAAIGDRPAQAGRRAGAGRRMP